MIQHTQQSDVEASQAANSQPIRRPGWGLIQDVHPGRTPRSDAHAPSEATVRPAPTHHHPVLPKPATSRSPERRIQEKLRHHSVLLLSPIIILVSIALSIVPLIGYLVIALYGLLAVIRRTPSRVSFWLATMVLLGIGVEFLFLSVAGRVGNGALFAFVLLCLGLASSLRETRQMAGREKALRRR